VIEAVDPQTKTITWKVIGGDLLELYNSFTIITSCDHEWTTWTFMYEKKTKDIPESLVLLAYVLHVTKRNRRSPSQVIKHQCYSMTHFHIFTYAIYICTHIYMCPCVIYWLDSFIYLASV